MLTWQAGSPLGADFAEGFPRPLSIVPPVGDLVARGEVDALLIIADFAAYFWPGRNTVGLDALAFILTLILAGYAMWRVWRAERTYGY